MSSQYRPDPQLLVQRHESLDRSHVCLLGSLSQGHQCSWSRQDPAKHAGSAADHAQHQSITSGWSLAPIERLLGYVSPGSKGELSGKCQADEQDILENLRNTTKPPFSFEDYNTMLNLICKTDSLSSPDAGPSSSDLNTYLIDLHALMPCP